MCTVFQLSTCVFVYVFLEKLKTKRSADVFALETQKKTYKRAHRGQTFRIMSGLAYSNSDGKIAAESAASFFISSTSLAVANRFLEQN